ncbi:hypothetical protein EPUS_06515 [Endocarpon pusillum Z07020]|uniref:Uncharacterized protein n=1 Tax=Endocarpon pusillum (strain Z07020 / HMAS-L-300199) TaxID=1263415 RepID=U1GJE0_ENDPU|nr:uncharacterized protein EPUS_06515 [Endocarpon pusillum Z07020]ERF71956.1 hypothetical protein EPUS_06515 [Endocarpon pusillum Z07020]
MSPSTSAENGEDHAGPTPIAVVGYDFEFPQEATSTESFWQMLCEGRCASTEFPKDRINIDAFYHPDRSRNSTVAARGGCFVTEPLGAFDAPFFSILPVEAACMDPQHRKMLEVAYHALEDVYTGSFTDDYRSVMQQDFESQHTHAATGIAFSMLANRLSWFFNFKGASVNLDSACSSSLSALHFACQDLWNETASMALVGGANYMYHPDFMRFLSNLNFLSPDSRCWSFDERANGYARGEGCAVLVLKRLPDAIKNGDNVRAVIRNTGLNQDGRTPGITVPNEDAQVDLITSTYRKAGLSMEPTRYFEAHGTGTPVGDPKEASAIGRSFAHCRTADDPLYVGAVKANIGHLEGCSGLAGIIKTMLVLEKGFIPPIAGLNTLNKKIEPEKRHLHFLRVGIPWPVGGLRRACVNSFGFGGTNAAAILDDVNSHLEFYKVHDPIHRQHQAVNGVSTPLLNSTSTNERRNSSDMRLISSAKGESIDHTAIDKLSMSRTPPSHPRLLVWSAFDREGATRLAKLYVERQDSNTEMHDDVFYTVSQRRTLFPWRCHAVFDQHSDVSNTCYSISEPIRATESRRIAFIFTGQGAQYQGMGRQLLKYHVFHDSLMDLDGCLRAHGCSWSVHDFVTEAAKDGSIDKPEYAQPLTTCMQIALVDLFRSFGIIPSVVLGHSSGEIAAAYAAGALSRYAAVNVAYQRGQVSSSVARDCGELGMMAVGLSSEEILRYIQRLQASYTKVEVTVACINSPKSVTLSGRAKQLNLLENWLRADAVFTRQLRTPVAYHSPFMQTVADDYATAIGTLEYPLQGESVPLLSSLTGDIVLHETLQDPQYWVRNMVSTVQFDTAFSRLLAQSNKKARKKLGKKNQDTFQITDALEIGPHSTLRGPIRDITNAFASTKKIAYTPSLIRGEDAAVAVLKMAGTLHCAGVPVEIAKVNQLESRPTKRAVNLPKYPFNHKQIYWEESRLSKKVRYPKHARNDILGTQIPDGNPHTPQWRNIMRTSELPWIEDHRIQGERIFPASGSLVMAIEAFKQSFDDDALLQGCQIRNVAFIHPIEFPPGADRVETRLELSLPPPNADRCSTWSKFRVFVIDDNENFIECCSGAIRGCKVDNMQGAGFPMPALKGGETFEDWVRSINGNCMDDLDVQAIYDAATSEGVQYGPCFQVLDKLRLGQQGEAAAEIKAGQWRKTASSSSVTLHPVHPTVLDASMQLLTLALSRGRQDFATMVPSRISNLWIDCQHKEILNDGRISTMTKSWLQGYRKAGADIIATKLDLRNPLFWLQGMEATFIGGFDSSMAASRYADPNLCMRLTWRPDISRMSNQQIQAECTRERPNGPSNQVAFYRSMTLAASTFIYEALAYTDAQPSLSLPQHLRSYIEWMKYQQERVRSGRFPFRESEVRHLLGSSPERAQLINDIEHTDSEGKLMMVIGRNLIPILRQEVDPLDLLFRDGLADQFYETMLSNPYHSHPSRAYLNLLSFKDPSMNILEVGAGTGGQTLACLQALSSRDAKCFRRYDYTDISAGFFGPARTKFAEYEHLMRFKTFDVEKDPVGQGFEAASYDLIIASHVIHATKTLEVSLRHVRKLLKPGGKLLLFETTRPEYLLVGFAFGLLRGWWSPLGHEDRAEYSPCVSAVTWDERLRSSGFSGVDMEFLGQKEAECQYSSIIVSTAVDLTNGGEHHEGQIAVVVNPEVEAQRTLARSLQQRLASCKVYTLAELAADETPPSGPALFLVEVDAVLLYDMTATEYKNVQSILIRFRDTLWVVRSASGEPDPRHGVVDGLARALASEDSTRKFTTLTLQDESEDGEGATERIADALARQYSPVENLENHIVVRNCVPHINRITEYHDINVMIAQKTSIQRIEERRLDGTAQLELRMAAPAALHMLGYCEDDTQMPPLGDDEVLIEVRAFGLTIRSYLSATGHLDEPDLGTECAGVVQAAGKACSFQPGDRVTCIGIRTSRTLIRSKASAVVRIQENMSFHEAASMPSAIWTAYHALFDIGRIEEGDTVLIYDAATSIGQVAIQMARRVGAAILVTAQSQVSTTLLRDSFHIATSSILSCADSVLPSEVHSKTHGKGVDIFMGNLSSDSMSDYAQCLAAFGRLIDIEAKKPNSGSSAPSMSMPRNITQASIDLTEHLKYKPIASYKTFQKAVRLASECAIEAPQPLHIFQAGEIESAFRHFEQKDAVGPVVVEFAPNDTVQAYVPNKPKYCFDSDSTFIIAGGLGGLGRSFARWMADRGARHLVLLSRNGIKTKPAEKLVVELRARDITVATPACDVTNLNMLLQVMGEVSRTMPPVRGCIQATVALRDATFENMTYDDWKVGLDSKALGSWNLHHALPPRLDFFVIIASLNGIFGDALAHHRIAHGQKAVSIDLGLMVAEGIVAENEAMLASLRRVGYLKDIRQEDLIALLDYYCDPSLPLLPPDDVQVLVGAELPSAVLAKGIDLHHSIRRPISRHLFRMGAHSGGTAPQSRGGSSTIDRAAALRDSASNEEAERLTTAWFAAKVAHVLGLAEADIETSKPVHAYGIDSLVAIDLKNWLQKELGAEVSVIQLLGNATIVELGAIAAAKSAFRKEIKPPQTLE